MLSNKELESIRASQREFLPEQVLLLRPEFIAPGEYADHILQEDVAARFTPGFGRFRQVADRYQAITPYQITFEHDIDVRVGDKIVNEDATIFEIREVRTPGSMITAVQALGDRVND